VWTPGTLYLLGPDTQGGTCHPTVKYRDCAKVGVQWQCRSLPNDVGYLLQKCGPVGTTVRKMYHFVCLRLLKFLNQTTSTFTYANVTRCHPGAHELICSQPVAVRWWHIVSPPIKKSQQIYVHPRTGPHSAHLWWPAVAKLQAASCAIGQTNGRIALFQNAPPPR